MITRINALIPKEVTASQGTGTTVVVTAVDPGVNGNAIVFTESCTLFAMDGSGYLGGTTAGVDRVDSIYNILRASNSDQAANIVALPTTGKLYWVSNATSYVVTIKASGQTGVAVSAGKCCVVIGNGTDFTSFAPEIPSATITAAMLEANIALAAPNITFGAVSHNYAGAAADWTLSTAEMKASIIRATNANGVCNAIALPTDGKQYWVFNSTGYVLTIKASGQTGVAIANGKCCSVVGNATDFVSAAPDIPAASITGSMLEATIALTAPDITFGATSAHDIASGHVAWTLSASEAKANILETMGTGDAGFDIVVPATANKIYIVVNGSGQAATVKQTGQTGVAVATLKTAIIRVTATDVARVTADA
jgi:hypothetical protein